MFNKKAKFSEFDNSSQMCESIGRILKSKKRRRNSLFRKNIIMFMKIMCMNMNTHNVMIQ